MLLPFSVRSKDSPQASKDSFVKALLSFVKCLVDNRAVVMPALVVLTVEVLCNAKLNGLALALLRSKEGGKVAPFGIDCVELAEALFKVGKKHGDAQIVVFGLDMLKRCGTHEARNKLVSFLLLENDFLDAVAAAKEGYAKNSYVTGRPSFLEFWNACLFAVKNAEGDGDRCRLFYHLFAFLKDYDPDCISTKIGKDRDRSSSSGAARKGSRSLRILSTLAKDVGNFPEELFESKAVIASLKSIFGFVV